MLVIDINYQQKMNKKILVIIFALIAIISLVIILVVFLAKPKNGEPVANLPSLGSGQVSLEQMPEVSPTAKTNPFKDVKTNPFD